MKLTDRHHNELMSRLDQVWLVGYAVITREELKYWYSRERITAAIWKDIRSKWCELSEENYWDEENHSYPDLKIGLNDDHYVLVWAEKDWLIDFEDLLRDERPAADIEEDEVDVLAVGDENEPDVKPYRGKPSDQEASDANIPPTRKIDFGHKPSDQEGSDGSIPPTPRLNFRRVRG